MCFVYRLHTYTNCICFGYFPWFRLLSPLGGSVVDFLFCWGVALKDSKAEMQGAKLNLVQVTGAKVAKNANTVALLSKLDAAPKFQYHKSQHGR